jgi:hypothetical protein
MIRWFYFFWGVIFFSFSADAAILDRILASVNDDIITQSDVDIALRFHLTDIVLPPAVSLREGDLQVYRQKVLQQLIDRRLLLLEAGKFNITPEELSGGEIDEERNRVKGNFTPEEFQAALKSYGIGEADLEGRFRVTAAVEKFLNFRVRFFVTVPPDSVRKYYREHEADYKDRSFEAIQKEIEKLLTDQEVARILEEYLERLRGQAKIRVNPLD